MGIWNQADALIGWSVKHYHDDTKGLDRRDGYKLHVRSFKNITHKDPLEHVSTSVISYIIRCIGKAFKTIFHIRGTSLSEELQAFHTIRKQIDENFIKRYHQLHADVDISKIYKAVHAFDTYVTSCHEALIRHGKSNESIRYENLLEPCLAVEYAQVQVQYGNGQILFNGKSISDIAAQYTANEGDVLQSMAVIIGKNDSKKIAPLVEYVTTRVIEAPLHGQDQVKIDAEDLTPVTSFLQILPEKQVNEAIAHALEPCVHSNVIKTRLKKIEGLPTEQKEQAYKATIDYLGRVMAYCLIARPCLQNEFFDKLRQQITSSLRHIGTVEDTAFYDAVRAHIANKEDVSSSKGIVCKLGCVRQLSIPHTKTRAVVKVDSLQKMCAPQSTFQVKQESTAKKVVSCVSDVLMGGIRGIFNVGKSLISTPNLIVGGAGALGLYGVGRVPGIGPFIVNNLALPIVYKMAAPLVAAGISQGVVAEVLKKMGMSKERIRFFAPAIGGLVGIMVFVLEGKAVAEWFQDTATFKLPEAEQNLLKHKVEEVACFFETRENTEGMTVIEKIADVLTPDEPPTPEAEQQFYHDAIAGFFNSFREFRSEM